MTNKEKITEKKLFASSAAYILGLAPIQKINGTHSQIDSYKKVLSASKDLYEALKNNDSAEKIFALVQEKKERAKALHKETGINWPF